MAQNVFAKKHQFYEKEKEWLACNICNGAKKYCKSYPKTCLKIDDRKNQKYVYFKHFSLTITLYLFIQHVFSNSNKFIATVPTTLMSGSNGLSIFALLKMQLPYEKTY